MAKYGMNQVTLIGNIGKDPKEQLRYLDQGIAVCTIPLACTERARDRDGNYVDKTEWIDVNLWRGNAEIVGKYCRKGSTICIEGKIITRNWETPEGEKRYKTEVQASRVILLDSRPQEQQSGGMQQSAASSYNGPSQPFQNQQQSHQTAAIPATNTPITHTPDPASSMNKEQEDLDDLPF